MEWIIIAIIALMYGVDVFVGVLNYQHKDRDIPRNVQGIYDDNTYEQWKDYTMETFRLSLIRKSVSVLLLLVLLLSGFFGWLEALLPNSPTVVHTLLFLLVYFFINKLVSLPFAYIRTFKIEAAFGFNKTTKALFVKDQIKGVLLTLVLGGALVSAINGFYLWLFDDAWLFVLIAFTSISIVMVLLFMLSGVFVRLFNTLEPLEEGKLKTSIDNLAESLGFSVKNIYVMDASKRSTKLNAFFSGLGKRREVVLFDTLIEKMDTPEIVAVLAHELGHATYKDTFRMLMYQIVIIFLYSALFALILTSDTLAQAFGLSGAHFAFAIILFNILLSPVDLGIGILLNRLSRRAEYRADAFAVKHTSKNSMARALRVLSAENFANLTPHPLYVTLNYSHPPIDARLDAFGVHAPLEAVSHNEQQRSSE